MSSDLVTKRMAQLIRAGATLTSYPCPACGTPLLRLKSGEYYCAACEKQVVIVKSEEEEREVSVRFRLLEVRETLLSSLMRLNDRLRSIGDGDLGELMEVLRAMILVLDAYDKVSHIVGYQARERGVDEASQRSGSLKHT